MADFEQAGIYKISLYENKDLSFDYTGVGSITGINYGGNLIEIENSNDNTCMLSLVQTPERNSNNELRYNSTISYILYDYSVENLQVIQKLKQSIYGWIALIEFYNGDLKIINTPLRFDNSAMKNESNSFSIELKTIIPGKKPVTYTKLDDSGTEWILEQGIWNKNGIWTSDGIWKTA